jgi:ATP-dependent Clp protease adaptor protein ClpS
MAMTTSTTAPTPTKQETHPSREVVRQPRKLPEYNVVLLDDDDHTYEYVIDMLRKLFGYAEEQAYDLACHVDLHKRVVVATTTQEHAELKRDQIHAFGRDWRIAECAGSMSSLVEPAS